ncbi:MAG: GspE/PulE family protein [Phycisphaerales bacterium JB043]
MKPAQINATKLQLGEILTARGVISTPQLKEALQEQASQGRRRLLGEILVDMNFVSSQQVMEALAECYAVPYVKVTPKVADPRITEVLSPEFLSNHCILPLFLVRGVLTVAVSEPANLFLIEEIERITGFDVQIVASTASDIRGTLQSHVPSANVFVIDDIYRDVELRDFSVVDAQVADITNLEEISGKSPVIKLVNYIVYQAVQDRASDVHVEPDDHECRVRYRIDGRLVTRLNPPHQMHPAVVSRIKIMSGLDISERRMPQDGDIHVMLDGRPIDLRVSTMPGKWGEKVVIRIIDNRSAIVPLERIGFATEVLDEWKQIITAPNGIILVTGPTGSGKSTTLYSVLSEVASEELNISTVENPVEVNIPGINQFQINERTGFTFASALRAMLRQDPDIVMVGEIRDNETATIATQAALTGHVVYSTLHTNDSISAVTRLVNMGIESYLVAAMLRGVLAQRLVRKICPHCKEEHEPDERLQAVLHDTVGKVGTLYHGAGCSRCHGKGYAGRIGIFELFSPPDAMLEAISEGLGLHELRAIAQRIGFRSLRHDGIEKSLAGLTTVDEVLRVCSL